MVNINVFLNLFYIVKADLSPSTIELYNNYHKVNFILIIQYCNNDLLLQIPYVTLFEYMYYLRELAILCNKKSYIFYLAAAVSDFYIPESQMVYII